MIKVLLIGLMLCSSTIVLAENEQVASTSDEALQSFLAKNDIEKQSVLIDLMSVQNYEEAQYLLAEWEKSAPEGKGPSDFLKSFINDFVKEAE